MLQQIPFPLSFVESARLAEGQSPALIPALLLVALGDMSHRQFRVYRQPKPPRLLQHRQLMQVCLPRSRQPAPVRDQSLYCFTKIRHKSTLLWLLLCFWLLCLRWLHRWQWIGSIESLLSLLCIFSGLGIILLFLYINIADTV